MDKAKYCKCLNTYTLKGCKKLGCEQPYYWSQGIGSIYKTTDYLLTEDRGFLLQEDNNKIIL